MEKLHPHAAIIDAIGRDVVRDHFATTRQLVHLWRQRGVPAKRWGALINLAQSHDVAASYKLLGEAVAQ